MVYLGKKELEILIKKAEEFYQSIIKLSKEEHDCIFAVALLKQEGKIDTLKEIYEKYYIVKKKDSLAKRKKQTIEMFNHRISRVQKRAGKYLKDTKKSFKYIDTDSKIYDLKKELKILKIS